MAAGNSRCNICPRYSGTPSTFSSPFYTDAAYEQHLVLDIDRVLNAYTAHLDVPNAAITYYNDLSVQRRLAKTSTYMILTLVSDAIIVRIYSALLLPSSILPYLPSQVYRAFVVWGRSYATALFPFILFLADIGKQSTSPHSAALSIHI